MSESKNKALTASTLLGFVRGLIGEHVRIELRNETQVSGRLTCVTVQMDLQLENVLIRKPNDFWCSSFTETRVDFLFIKSTRYRFVRFDERLDAQQVLNNELQSLKTEMHSRVDQPSNKPEESLIRYARKGASTSNG